MKRPAMIKDMIGLHSLVEKSADADPLRDMIDFADNKLMEVNSKTGALYEKSDFRLAQRWLSRSPLGNERWNSQAASRQLFPELSGA